MPPKTGKLSSVPTSPSIQDRRRSAKATTNSGIWMQAKMMLYPDMPWLHQPDHAAAMVYPRPASALSADLERLYALGIDAFRVAQEMIKARTDFEIDGVTGNLQVRQGVIGRAPLMVEFRDGVVAPVRAGR